MFSHWSPSKNYNHKHDVAPMLILELINEYKSFTDRTIDIVTVARIASEKRILLGVEMFYKIHEINPDVRWHIFGYGNDKY